MFTITLGQLETWIASVIYPLTRILAVAVTAPLLSNAAMPRRIRLMLGLALTLGISPILPPMPDVTPASGLGLWILAQQILIGVGMGLSMRIIFTAIDMGSAVVAFQMGLGFANFYDPQNTSQTSVVSNFMTLIATLLFISMNGHLIYFAVIAQSFIAIPISTTSLQPTSWEFLALLGSRIFSTGVLLALPIVVMMMCCNLSLGVLNRVAPQLHLFAIGFPITLMLGFVCLAIMMGHLPAPLERIFNEGLTAMLAFALPPMPDASRMPFPEILKTP
ncbi:MAG: flagellar biosynthetic protein FliR [Zoogloeaceae bacterium]|jgi:flagellar biosynthetic protein FliR|nr:flagellar biosynthetic protein FliR [Zoogloeaceae bacterium]